MNQTLKYIVDIICFNDINQPFRNYKNWLVDELNIGIFIFFEMYSIMYIFAIIAIKIFL